MEIRPEEEAEIRPEDNDRGTRTRGSVRVMLAIALVSSANYSMVIPTSYQYVTKIGGDTSTEGKVLGAYSLARLVLFLPVGAWADARPMREVLTCCMILLVIGNVIYALALPASVYYGKGYARTILFVSRLVVGAGATSAAVTTSYIALTVSSAKRGKALAMQNAMTLLGILLGPAFMSLLDLMDDLVPKSLWYQKVNGVGWVSAFMSMVLLVLVLFVVVEPDRASESKKTTELSVHGSSSLPPADAASRNDLELTSHPLIQRSIVAKSWDMIINGGGWWTLLTAFCTQFLISSIDTLLPVLAEDVLGLSTTELSAILAGYAISGALGLVMSSKCLPKAQHKILTRATEVTALSISIYEQNDSLLFESISHASQPEMNDGHGDLSFASTNMTVASVPKKYANSMASAASGPFMPSTASRRSAVAALLSAAPATPFIVKMLALSLGGLGWLIFGRNLPAIVGGGCIMATGSFAVLAVNSGLFSNIVDATAGRQLQGRFSAARQMMLSLGRLAGPFVFAVTYHESEEDDSKNDGNADEDPKNKFGEYIFNAVLLFVGFLPIMGAPIFWWTMKKRRWV